MISELDLIVVNINRNTIALELHPYSYPGSYHNETGLPSGILTVNVPSTGHV